MLKKSLVLIALVAGFGVFQTPSADAGVFVRRVAPVRRAVLPPYPVARRVVARPVVGPVYRPVYRPVVHPYAYPVYSPGVSVIVGF